MTRDDKGRFPKGVSGNPHGRKPRDAEEDAKALFRRAVSKQDQQAIITKAIELAKRGDDKSRRFIFEYLYGPPVQRQEHTGADGGAIVFIDETNRNTTTDSTPRANDD